MKPTRETRAAIDAVVAGLRDMNRSIEQQAARTRAALRRLPPEADALRIELEKHLEAFDLRDDNRPMFNPYRDADEIERLAGEL